MLGGPTGYILCYSLKHEGEVAYTDVNEVNKVKVL